MGRDAQHFSGLDFWNDPERWDRITDPCREYIWDAPRKPDVIDVRCKKVELKVVGGQIENNGLGQVNFNDFRQYRPGEHLQYHGLSMAQYQQQQVGQNALARGSSSLFDFLGVR